MGGTAAAVDGPLAGQNQVGSADIINGEVRTDDVGAAQVTGPKLAANSVNSAKIGDGEIQAAEIAQGAVGTSDVANESLGGGDITNGSLTSADLAKHTIVRDDLAFDISEPLTAAVGRQGGLLGGNGATGVQHSSTGIYDVTFAGVDVADCVPQGTMMFRGQEHGPDNGEISVARKADVPAPFDISAIRVTTWDSTAFGGAPPAQADRNFWLTLNC